MEKRDRRGRFAVGALILSATVSTDARAQAPAVDPAAVQKLKQMSEFLDGLKQFSVQTQNTIEDLHVSKHRIDKDLAANVTVKRPDKLLAVRVGELMDQRFFYDGKTLTLYNPREKVYATEAAPPTVEKMIDFARETVGILLPAADLLYRNAFPLMMQDVTLATVVGKAVIGGVKCDHLLFSRPGVDFQVWIAEGKATVPVQVRRHRDGHAERLSVSTVLINWKTDAAADDAQFRFVPPKGTSATRFLPVRQPARRIAETNTRKTMRTVYRIAGALIVLGAMSLAEIAGVSVGSCPTRTPSAAAGPPSSSGPRPARQARRRRRRTPRRPSNRPQQRSSRRQRRSSRRRRPSSERPQRRRRRKPPRSKLQQPSSRPPLPGSRCRWGPSSRPCPPAARPPRWAT